MPKMPIQWISEPEPKKNRLKPYLLLVLTVAVLGFCATLWLR
jgi:hypothetical protein